MCPCSRASYTYDVFLAQRRHVLYMTLLFANIEYQRFVVLKQGSFSYQHRWSEKLRQVLFCYSGFFSNFTLLGQDTVYRIVFVSCLLFVFGFTSCILSLLFPCCFICLHSLLVSLFCFLILYVVFSFRTFSYILCKCKDKCPLVTPKNSFKRMC